MSNASNSAPRPSPPTRFAIVSVVVISWLWYTIPPAKWFTFLSLAFLHNREMVDGTLRLKSTLADDRLLFDYLFLLVMSFTEISFFLMGKAMIGRRLPRNRVVNSMAATQPYCLLAVVVVHRNDISVWASCLLAAAIIWYWATFRYIDRQTPTIWSKDLGNHHVA